MDKLGNKYVSLGGSQRQKEDSSFSLRFDADYDYLLKMVIVGDCCVGKSLLLRRYAAREYPIESYISTIGVDFSIGRFKIDNSDSKIRLRTDSNKKRKISPNPFKIKLQIWDTAGQERFRSITQSYYRGMKLCILCFDSTSIGQPGSISSVPKWLADIKCHAGPNVNVYVIGTKTESSDDIPIKSDPDYTKSLKSIIDEIESFPDLNVRFMGWCSAKYNMYISNLDDITEIIRNNNSLEEDHCIWSSNKIAKNPNLANKNVPTISDMFETITFDYIRRASELSYDYKIKHYDNLNLDKPNDRLQCCDIL